MSGSFYLLLRCGPQVHSILIFQYPILGGPAAVLFALALLATVIFVRGKLLKLTICLGGFALVTGWWLTIKPTNNRVWQPDVARHCLGGNQWRPGHRSRRSQLRVPHGRRFHTALGHAHGAALPDYGHGSGDHVLGLALDGASDRQLSISLTRCHSAFPSRHVNQLGKSTGSARLISAVYAHLIVADERDSIRVRSNYRHGEDVYLYRTLASPPEAREHFLEYIQTINRLRDHPRWYNAVTTNCTTSIRTQRPRNERAPWDWRILVNGKGDELLYERHLIATGGLPFSELKQRSWINKLARAADQDPDFSRLIRANLPQTD